MKIKLKNGSQWTINRYFKFRDQVQRDIEISRRSDSYDPIALSRDTKIMKELDKQYTLMIGSPDFSLVSSTGKIFTVSSYFSLRASIDFERARKGQWLTDFMDSMKREKKDTPENNAILSELDILYTQKHLGWVLFEIDTSIKDLFRSKGEIVEVDEYLLLENQFEMEQICPRELYLELDYQPTTAEERELFIELKELYKNREQSKIVHIAGEELFVQIPNAIMSVSDRHLPQNMTFNIAREITKFLTGEDIHNHGMSLVNNIVNTVKTIKSASIVPDEISIDVLMIISDFLNFNSFINHNNTPELIKFTPYSDLDSDVVNNDEIDMSLSGEIIE